MKIGFAIQEVQQGAKIIFPKNSDDNLTKNVVDLRNVAISKAAIEEESPFLLVKNAHDGICLVCGYTTSGGRTNDYIAAWFFIHKDILPQLSEELDKYIFDTIQLIKAYDGEEKQLDDFAKVAKQFKDYKASECVYVKPFLNKTTKGYAVRYFNKEQLGQLLTREYLLQPSHADFDGVMLLEQSKWAEGCNLPEVSGKLLRLTDIKVDGKLKDVEVTLSLGEKTLKLEPGKKYYCHEDDELQLLTSRKNYAPQKAIVKMKTDELLFDPNKQNKKVCVGKNFFIVTDKSTGKRISDFSLRLPQIGKNQQVNDEKEITEEQARKLLVEIDADSYEPYRKTLNIFGQKMVNVEMEKKILKRTYLLPIADNKRFHFMAPFCGSAKQSRLLCSRSKEWLKIEQQQDIDSVPKSPVDGFKICESDRHTHTLKPFFDWSRPRNFVPVMAAFLIGVTVGLIAISFAGGERSEVTGSTCQADTVANTHQLEQDTVDLSDTVASVNDTSRHDEMPHHDDTANKE